MPNTKVEVISDFSGGVQNTTSRFLRKSNQVDLAINADFRRTGGVGSRKGYTVKGGSISTTTSTSTTTTTTSTSSSTSTSTTTSTTTT